MSEPQPEPQPEHGDDPQPEPGDDDEEVGEEEPAPTPEPAPEAPPAASEADIERNLKRLESEATRHANRVSEIMGEEAQNLVPCALCFPPTPGFTWPSHLIPEEQKAAVRVALGEAATLPLNPASDKERCSECDGWGRTLTGARGEAQVDLPCRKCNGQGWTAKLAAVPPLDASVTQAPSPTMPGGIGATDMWGRPAGHRDWGIAPALVGS